MARLTKRIVDGAPTRTTDYFIWCGDMPGFGIRVLPSGKRSYLVQYRAEGKSRRAVIGLHGPLTCDEARKEAAGMLGVVAKGGNPAEERLTRRGSMTVAELCDRYRKAAEAGLILGKRGGPKKPLTLASDFGRIDRHIIPLLGKKLVRDLNQTDVAKLIRDVTVGKTAGVAATKKLRGKSIVRGGQGAAARTAGLLGGILSFAVSEGVISANPATGVRKPAYKKKTGRLTANDYAALGSALISLSNEINASAVAIVQLLALTGCRRNEVNALRWSEVDLSGGALRLADTKEGASVRPAGAAALAVLANVARREGSEWVFPGERRDSHYAGLKGAWSKIVATAELSGVTLHTLRHSFASVAADLGYSESTIGAMLGHASGSVTGRYTHHLDAVLLAAADEVSRTIGGMLSGDVQPARPGAKPL
jgi:integrase